MLGLDSLEYFIFILFQKNKNKNTYAYLQKYHIIVLGLDSLEARRWINDMICRYISTYTYIHVYTRHTHTHMHTHTHTHTHIPICIDIYGGSMT